MSDFLSSVRATPEVQEKWNALERATIWAHETAQNHFTTQQHDKAVIAFREAQRDYDAALVRATLERAAEELDGFYEGPSGGGVFLRQLAEEVGHG